MAATPAGPNLGRVDPEAWGVVAGYEDTAGRWRQPSPEAVAAVLAALGAVEGGPPKGGPWFVAAGEAAPLAQPATVVLEDGTELRAEGSLPPDLPLGYHRVADERTGATTSLVVTPRRCRPPEVARGWGWAAQLYATRSGASWGVGDLGDLERLARLARRQGASLVMVNPLHAPRPGHPQEPSPYYPSSRLFRSLLYLDVTAVEGAGALGPELDALAAAGRALNHDRRLDRDAVWRLKRSALERLWARLGDPGAALDAYVAAGGPALEGFATYSVLAEEHGPAWRRWPAELRHPGAGAVAAVRRRHPDRVRFHQWVQWLLARQLEDAAEHVAVVQDLAVGSDPAGADAWLWQDLLAFGVAMGAPPDEFNLAGQDWGFPPFDPWRLRAADYAPFVGMLRAGMRGGGGIRLDHVLGLFRQYWIPREPAGAGGAYVRFPSGDLLDLVALESHRSGAFVVGEDLGTVEPGVREVLAARDVLSYRLLWFEPDGLGAWPAASLAAVTTHDLPTVAGLWSGRDLEDQRHAGVEPSVDGNRAACTALARTLGVDATTPVEEVAARAYARLAEAPSRLRAATLEDALGVEERPNLPGTTSQRPNWSLALPVPLEDLEAHPGVERLAAVMGGGGLGAPAGADAPEARSPC